MTVSCTLYNVAKYQLAKKGIDLSADTLKVTLHTSSYTPNIDSHVAYADLTNELSSGSGYTSGGATVAGKALSQDNTADKGKLTANDVTWSSSTLTARYAVLRDSTTDILIGYVDFGANVVSAGGDFAVSWNGSSGGTGGTVFTLA